ncbi:uncharacterized protein LODBEIA_P19640 [Lodderomyces beijingensis]|uniref:Prefoldin subunit 6 n=1 Tax=Lodderomyces beijingensis TaxID=1775926 RepID=A0ABP0ZN80_9ASCO
MAEAQKLESLSQKFAKHQETINELIQSRSQLETQFQENKIVQDEFQSLNSESKIYKLVGPILLPQEFTEADLNVKKRIEFIEGEIKRVETKIELEEKEMESIRSEIVQLRTSSVPA